MRVLHVHSEFSPQSSGVARHIDGLATELAQRHELEVAVFSSSRPELQDQPRPFRLTSGRAGALIQAIRKADIVHAHGSRTLIATLALRLARARGLATVFTPHCYYDGGSRLRQAGKAVWDRLVERRSIADADAVILLHEDWVPVLAAKGFRPRRTEIIPNCIRASASLERFEACVPVALEGEPAILSVSRLDRVKRLDDVIAALNGPGLARAHLHIVGRGPELEALTSLASAQQLGDRVHFHGWQSDEAVAAMMRGCSAMILASEQEGLPTVMLEALIARVPIAVSQIPGNMAIAREVDWTACFPLGDRHGMATALATCAADGVSADLSSRVMARFTWEKRAAEVAALYRELASAA